jgi:hypothetical protein
MITTFHALDADARAILDEFGPDPVTSIAMHVRSLSTMIGRLAGEAGSAEMIGDLAEIIDALAGVQRVVGDLTWERSAASAQAAE